MIGLRVALLLGAPAALALGFVFVMPMLRLGRMSFNRTLPGGAMQDDFTLDTHRGLWADPYYLELAWNSIELSVVACSCAVALSYPVALFLFRTTSRWRPLLMVLAVAPLLVNGVVRVFGWLAVLGDRGLVNAALKWIGLIDQPVRLIYNWTGVAIGLTESLMPYTILALLAGLGRVDRTLEEAAATLGARPWRSFLRVTLPLSLPAIVLSWLLAFVLAISAFVTPKLLGGARVMTLATEIYEQALVSLDWPLAASLALHMLVLLGLLLAAYGALTRRLVQ
ncbi:MAG: ABC transporter permease [Alphaproteobacteria bacterium]|nr:ABC transporter permease [Alphaproteobacteria bacterium]